MLVFVACQDKKETSGSNEVVSPSAEMYELVDFNKAPQDGVDSLIAKYTPFTLTTDISKLTDNEKELIRKLMEAGKIIDGMFWEQAYGDKDELLSSIEDPRLKAFAMINYGPWDRLNGNQPFIDGVGPKPSGANYYPADITKGDFEASSLENKSDLYTLLKKGPEFELEEVPYHEEWRSEVKEISRLLKEAAQLSENEALTKYLNLRSEAITTDDYQPSDMAWLDMKDNHIDVVIGPIETYEDQLYGYKAAYECYVLVKDMEWSERLAKYAQFLPDLQRGLPVPDAYKAEEPGRDTELNAYDVVWYSGDCNAGSKTIAINLPNDEEVQLQKGTRRLQLKNAMKAKYDKILVPIVEKLIHPDQRQYVNFDAFFANTMFHEVAHGLGIKNTINGKGTVRKALQEHASALEEGKADMLGLYMIDQLHKQGEIEGDLESYLVTFMAGIFRSVRFGASSAHGKANMIRFNFFDEYGAFTKDDDGYYKVDFDNFKKAMDALSEKILTLQGDGDYEGVAQLVSEKGKIGPGLQADLDMLSQEGIPVDVVFKQGTEVLGI
ncbi:MAG: Zn-dependent hydrolase [Saprospiraceae bacterium]|nr:Zn-dependent hydrolase [Saprospiraceae bacterium]